MRLRILLPVNNQERNFLFLSALVQLGEIVLPDVILTGEMVPQNYSNRIKILQEMYRGQYELPKQRVV